MQKDLVAACGMNCRLCLGYVREKNKCYGCRNIGDNKPKGCHQCSITKCPTIMTNKSGFCYECDKFPCLRLRNLDKRYREKYHMSMIENLNYIKQKGIEEFLENEKDKWTCKECGNIICVHRPVCLKCGKSYLEEAKR